MKARNLKAKSLATPSPSSKSANVELRVKIQLHKSLLLHPVVIASTVWIGVVSLYSMHLSKMLLYSSSEVITVALWILVPIVIAVFAFNLFHRMALFVSPGRDNNWEPSLDLIERRIKQWFRIWMAAAVIETVVSGGVPILWLFQNTAKNYDSYGITSVHGLVKSLFISLALVKFSLWAITGERKHLKIPVLALIWALITVDRSAFLVCIVEYAIVYSRFRSIQVGTLLKITIAVILLVLGFGAVGDFRLQGSSDIFRAMAQPSSSYPDWLPSGILWTYIYITTPINNLIFTTRIFTPIHNLLFPNTLALLFPTVIRNLLYGSQVNDALTGQLVSDTFNASTAYIGPYQDFGYFGIALFSAVIAIICQKYWLSKNLQGSLKFAVVTQCLILTLFSNHFFALPIVFQLVWIQVFFMRKLRFGSDVRINRVVDAKPREISNDAATIL